MSINVTEKVWALQMPRDEKFVYLAFAGHANPDGTNIFPSVASIAKKTGYSRRSVQAITKRLIEGGYLIEDGHGPRGTRRFRIPLEGAEISPMGHAQPVAPGGAISAAGGAVAAASEPLKNRHIKPSTGRLLEKPNAEPGEQIKVWTQISQDPAIKPHLRVEAIQSLLGARLNIHAATRRWKELAVYVDARQQEQGQMLETFLQWLTSKRDFDLRYWPPGRMLEMWPQAFPNPFSAQPERQWKYVNGELLEVME